ncbi:hypothetical protein [Erythrobacter sp. MTPC3]|uniref:hypothetical protein n=1 Tax=Erythrobacter sp. MTPC3 TaxID=3056564 RepID=UPI0036F2E28E
MRSATKSALAAALCTSAPFAASAQQQAAQTEVAPLTAVQPAPSADAYLPANTEVRMRMNETVTTKGKTWSEGDTFSLTVTHSVFQNGYVIIPEGSRGVGRITWLTNKGAFGKSGKMEVELEYVEVNGRRIDIDGTFRQDGEGNTVATIGGVLAAGVFAGFITGRSGTIPRGRELTAFTERAMPLALPQMGANSARRGTQALPVTPNPVPHDFKPVGPYSGG